MTTQQSQKTGILGVTFSNGVISQIQFDEGYGPQSIDIHKKTEWARICAKYEEELLQYKSLSTSPLKPIIPPTVSNTFQQLNIGLKLLVSIPIIGIMIVLAMRGTAIKQAFTSSSTQHITIIWFLFVFLAVLLVLFWLSQSKKQARSILYFFKRFIFFLTIFVTIVCIFVGFILLL